VKEKSLQTQEMGTDNYEQTCTANEGHVL